MKNFFILNPLILKSCLLILSILPVRTSWCQSSSVDSFISKYYVITEQHFIRDGELQSFKISDTELNGNQGVNFFIPKSIKQERDSIFLTASISTAWKNDDEYILDKKNKYIFNACTQDIKFSKSRKDSCWRGFYGSLRTGICYAIMTIDSNTIKIAGVSQYEASNFYVVYRVVTIPSDLKLEIMNYNRE
jgi:hypothetical protein